MGLEGFDFSEIEGVSPSFVEALYRRFKASPNTVEASWREFFDGLEETASGPSWQRPNWPVAVTDSLTAALDPTQMAIAASEPAPAAPSYSKSLSSDVIERAAGNSIRAMMLIRTYRVRGHLAANLDPLKLSKRELPADLTPEFYGFAEDELDTPVYLGGALGLHTATVNELVAILRDNYCGPVGLEYMHINDLAERRFLQERMEGKETAIQFTPEGKQAILAKVIHAEQWESFLGKKYVGTKRFGLDGGESMVPALEAVIKYGGADGVKEIVIGMAHRGRLNVLANVMAKPYRAIFHEFAGGASNPEDVGGSGDVKYHLGTSTDREFDGISVHMSLVPNPSHLEAADPVVLGKTRATQVLREDLTEHKEVLPLLLHGDAAFAGQGIVAECFGFSGIPGYNTGGCIHFIINNQIGFTTSPQFARSSPYPSDIGKVVQAPILHVNGDDPEAVTFACKLAVEFRQTFRRDVVIDMWCYRRFGHNEGDEPSFTQPVMYRAIKTHPKVSKIYGDRLSTEGVVDEDWIEEATGDFIRLLEDEFEAGQSYLPNKADWFGGRWEGLGMPADPETARRGVVSGVQRETLLKIGEVLTSVPDDLEIHKTLGRILNAKREMFESGEGFDWATAEALAFGTLLHEDYGVRLSGQDSGRGTFSQRHAEWYDQETSRRYTPLEHVPGGQFDVLNSPLSEFGVLGFEYGYSLADPMTLVLWEAQFGDFANGAQVMIDQFIASGEAKWLRANGLVMLLPHGYEGQGPEHSSARLERYLQLCAGDNMQVCNITEPANYFHVLRRQMHRPFRKPLIIMTPKSLLRHKLAVSKIDDFLDDSHFMRIKSDPVAPEGGDIERLILCSGKVAYDLIEARSDDEAKRISIVRLEQLYPFPAEPLAIRLKRMNNLKQVIWCQEEPKNQGAWMFARHYIDECLEEAGIGSGRVEYAGREPSASPATGLASRHRQQQETLIADALGREGKK